LGQFRHQSCVGRRTPGQGQSYRCVRLGGFAERGFRFHCGQSIQCPRLRRGAV
jgi:hypothetical protein